MKISILFAAFVCLSQVSLAQTRKEISVKSDWFNGKNCAGLEIRKYKSISDHQLVKSVKLSDRDAIQNMIARIEKIPADGQMMKSFGDDAEFTEMAFACDAGKNQTIEIYNGRFKTPSTGFNTGKSELEAGLCADIDALLSPGLDKKILITQGLELKFDDFSVVYKGKVFFQDPRKTISWTDYEFSVKDKVGQGQTFKIRSGQLPPSAYIFEVSGKKLNLLTYQTKDKDRLFPNYFQITK
jgi:hypothetical protein